jgi:hypothetical protein
MDEKWTMMNKIHLINEKWKMMDDHIHDDTNKLLWNVINKMCIKHMCS